MSTTGTPRTGSTVFEVMRRPRWIGMLVLALAVAAGFALLGQWQLGRAVSSGEVVGTQSETVRPLAEIGVPQAPVFESQAAQKAEAVGGYTISGFDILGDRLNGDEAGYWVIGQFTVRDPADTHLAVALGWTADPDEARRIAEQLSSGRGDILETIVGRYLPTEAPQASDLYEPVDGITSLDGSPLETTMSVASLVNRWSEFDDDAEVYGGYLVLDDPAPGLEAILSPEPDRSVQLNWLNIFYAAEWVVFAGFAVYLWYRLVRDAWERENEDDDDEGTAGPEPLRG
ncbi:SURF1 family protein [Herbiconiux sp. CPCC 203407]|uniref:SURF1-like protein n=1 Tax=Herbiconiux oxytropis TaxID=2970915 RepID=A0AA41XAW3_9MICO|nr:SURF1 family cytochrome oxidase biogenesis protein [Herbiconiux oxytropis]MCS5721160.1 SURF1 family protein [Herbiconiux oxytropis]MCS5724812.1 SURF1 family protein [Herbiconiux oxytropis]